MKNVPPQISTSQGDFVLVFVLHNCQNKANRHRSMEIIMCTVAFDGQSSKDLCCKIVKNWLLNWHILQSSSVNNQSWMFVAQTQTQQNRQTQNSTKNCMDGENMNMATTFGDWNVVHCRNVPHLKSSSFLQTLRNTRNVSGLVSFLLSVRYNESRLPIPKASWLFLVVVSAQ